MKTNGILKTLSSAFSKENRVKTIIILGVLGMIFILLSEWFPFSGGEGTASSPTANETEEVTKKQIEDRLTELLSGIVGVGKCQVMVTFEQSAENVYENNRKQSSDSSSADGRTGEKTTDEQSVIIVENKDGSKEALLKTKIEPKIKGVVIACEGGEDVTVESRIIGVVTTAFQLPTNQVYVTVLENR